MKMSLSMIALALLATAEVGAAVSDRWVYKTGEFRHLGGGRWEEIINGRKAFTFIESARGANEVVLWDKSRGIQVKLNYVEAKVFQGARHVLTHQGTFWFSVFSYAGGEFRYMGGNRWDEYQGGRKVFSFTQTKRWARAVNLYDASRGLVVTVSLEAFTVTIPAEPGRYLMVKKGRWVR